MKKIHLIERRRKANFIAWLICFALANLINLYAIIAYDTSFVELFTSIGYVTVASLVFYLVWILLRAVYLLVVLCKSRTTR